MASLSETEFHTITIRSSGSERGAQAVVVAICPVRGGEAVPEEAEEWFVRFSGRIPPRTRADNNIDGDMMRRISEGMPLEEVASQVASRIGAGPVVVFGKDLVLPSLPFVDSERALDGTRLARRLWERGTMGHDGRLESHRVYELRFWLGLDPDVLSHEPTGAFAESINAACVFSEQLKAALKRGCEDSEKGLFEFVAAPVEYTRVPYGRSAGMPFGEVPGRDLEKMVSGDDVDPDLAMAVERELAERSSKVSSMGVFRRG